VKDIQGKIIIYKLYESRIISTQNFRKKLQNCGTIISTEVIKNAALQINKGE
jgi:hypothetical protein